MKKKKLRKIAEDEWSKIHIHTDKTTLIKKKYIIKATTIKSIYLYIYLHLYYIAYNSL